MGVAVAITYVFLLADIKFRRLMTLTLKCFFLFDGNKTISCIPNDEKRLRLQAH